MENLFLTESNVQMLWNIIARTISHRQLTPSQHESVRNTFDSILGTFRSRPVADYSALVSQNKELLATVLHHVAHIHLRKVNITDESVDIVRDIQDVNESPPNQLYVNVNRSIAQWNLDLDPIPSPESTQKHVEWSEPITSYIPPTQRIDEPDGESDLREQLNHILARLSVVEEELAALKRGRDDTIR